MAKWWWVWAAGFVAMANAAPVQNFGQNLTRLQQAAVNKQVHILQIGDSHTAGDYFTGQLRKRLQAQMGDGGVGFAYPAKLSGQRTARHGYGANGWQVYNVRHQKIGDYPLGGVYAVSDGTPFELTSRYYQGKRQQARILVKAKGGESLSVSDRLGTRRHTLGQGWQIINDSLTFPATINADKGVAIGGFYLTNRVGGVVSAMGINGATQTYWNYWRQIGQGLKAANADLVVLAYGTNEAFQNNPNGHKQAVQMAINHIRSSLPTAAILIVAPPNSLKQTGGICGTPPPSLDKVRQNLHALAQQNKTLYWDWQVAMGGDCGMKQWMAQGLGAKDGVHFTAKGYEKAANDLYDNLWPLLAGAVSSGVNGSGRSYVSPQTVSPQTPAPTPTTGGFGIICKAGNCEKL